VPSILQDASFESAAQAKQNDGNTLTTEEEEVARVNTDAVVEFACAFVVVKSSRGSAEEFCTKHLRSVQPVSVHKELGDRTFLAGVP
jgi:hypothetical protein